MPKRMVSHGRRDRNSDNNARRGVSRKVRVSNARKIKKQSFNNKKSLSNIGSTFAMGTTVALTGIFGFFILNNVIPTNQDVEAIDRIALPERQLPGVSVVGQKYADDATVVMQKLQNYQYRNDGKKVVYLTFDDGPSQMTSKILDVLEKNDVRATFFVMGSSLERSGQAGKQILKRSYEYGNAIANHSYSHDYNELYPNKTLDLEAFKADFEKSEQLLKNALGESFETKVWRCPGGHMSWNGMDKLQEYLDENDISSIDWNALTGDAEGKAKTSDDLYNEAVKTSQGKEMVVLLMHDASSKENTVNALQRIIDYYKDNGYEFRTLI